MALSKVEICNRALVLLGEAGVLSTGQEDQDARTCELQYRPCVVSLLEKGNWTFATKRAKLNLLAEVPAFGYAHMYELPGDFLKMQEVCFSGIKVEDITQFSIEDGKVLCDEGDSVQIKYTYDQTDPKRFSELFAEAVATRIAEKVCYALVESSTVRDRMTNDSLRAFTEAAAYDSMNQSKQLSWRSNVVAFKY